MGNSYISKNILIYHESLDYTDEECEIDINKWNKREWYKLFIHNKDIDCSKLRKYYFRYIYRNPEIYKLSLKQ